MISYSIFSYSSSILVKICIFCIHFIAVFYVGHASKKPSGKAKYKCLRLFPKLERWHLHLLI